MANVSDMLAQAIGTPNILPTTDVGLPTDGNPYTNDPSYVAPPIDPMDQGEVYVGNLKGTPLSTKVDALTGNTDTKRSSVADAAASKKTTMGSNNITPYQNAVAQQKGISDQHMSTEEADMLNLSPSKLYGKYGSQATQMLLARAAGSYDLTTDASVSNRDMVDTTADTLAAGATAYGSTLAGLGALGLGVVNDSAGAWASEKIQGVNEFVDSTQSDKLQASKRILEAKNFLTSKANAAQYEIDRQTEGDTLAGLRQIGRDTMSSLDNATDDSTTFGDGLASALGSLFAVGPVAGGLRKLGSALIPETTKRGVGLAAAMDAATGSPSVARLLAGAAKAAPVPLAIGGIEAGGSYQQITADIMGRTHETLLMESPLYREELTQKGDTPENRQAAKEMVANHTGLRAAAITAPGAIVAGSLVRGFEGAPLAAMTGRSVRQAALNAGKETGEETMQGGISQLAQNFAEQGIANENQTLSEGVGRQLAEGGLYGMGMSATIQAPQLLKQAAQATGQAAVNAVVNRVDALIEANKKASPIADTTILKAATEAQTSAPQAEPVLREAINSLADVAPEAKVAANAYVDRLLTASNFDLNQEQGVPEVAKPYLGDVTNRVDAIQRMAQLVNSAEANSADQLDAGFYLHQLVSEYADHLNADPAALNELPAEHQAKQILGQYVALMDNIGKTPKVMEAINAVMDAIEAKAAKHPPAVEVPRVTVGKAGSWTDQNAQTFRDQADRLGITKDIEELFAQGLTAKQVQTSLAQADKLKAIPQEDLGSFIVSVRATLGIPSRADTEGQAEFEVWQAARNTRNSSGINEVSLSTPAGQQAVKEAIAVAGIAPDKGHLETNEQILFQVSQGKLQVTPEQKAALDTSVAILRAVRAADEQAQRLGQADPVSLNISSVDGEKGKSVVQHAQGIMAAWKAGNRNLAAERLVELHNFAQSMANKLGAINTHFAAGNPEAQGVRYSTYANGDWFPSKTAWQVHPTSEGSVKIAQKIAGESKLLADVYNGLVTAFPDLKGQHISVTPLDVLLDGPAQTVVAKHRAAQSKTPAPKVEVSPAVPVTPPAAVVVQTPVVPAVPEKTAPVAKAPRVDTAKIARLDNVNLEERLNQLADLPNRTAKQQAELDALEAELTQREALSNKVAKLDDVNLNERLNQLSDLKTKTAQQQAEFEALDAEMSRREDAAQLVNEQEAAAEEVVEESVAEPVAEPTVSTPEPQGLASAFPNLLQTFTNYFTQSFKLPKTAKTRLFGTETPFSILKSALSSSSKLMAFMGGEAKGELTKEIASAYQTYLSKGQGYAETLDDNLQKFLAKKWTKKDKTMLELALAGDDDVNRLVNGKVMNLVEQDGDTLAYNPELMGTAILAGLQWLMTADSLGSILDTKDVMAMTGLPDVMVSEALVQQLNEGLSTVEAKRALADKIVKYWGVQKDANGLLGYQEGIPEAMAAELLRAMEANGDLTVKTITLTEADGLPALPNGKPNVKKINRLIFTPLAEDSPLRQFPSAIEQAVLLEPEDVSFIGEGNLPPVAKNQLRNPSVPNTPQQLAMIENDQATSHYIDVPMAALYSALGKDNLLKMFAAGDLSTRKLNVNHALSLDGQNRGLSAAFNHLQGLIQEVNNQSSGALGQTPIHYAYNVTRVARLQMLGKHNSQANKLVREAILPTRATLDLSNQLGADHLGFSLGLAQALGIKVHKQLHETSAQEVHALLEGPLQESVEVLQNWLKGVDDKAVLSPQRELPLSIVEGFINNFKAVGKKGLPLTPAAFHAVLEYARFLNAPDVSEFTTSLYLEADGMTNGPVNAMQLFTTGEFEAKWILNMAKGGMYLNRPGMTANQYNQKVDNQDLYQATTNQMKELMETLRKSFKKNDPAAAQMKNMLHLMDLFLPDMQFDGTTMTIDRGITKNPLTITIYGSGAGGIAAKIVQALTEAIYEKMSELADAQDRDPSLSESQAMFGTYSDADAKMALFTSSLTPLITKEAQKVFGKIKLSDNAVTRKSNKFYPEKFYPEKFTFELGELRNMQSNILHLFVGPMRTAINEVVGEPLMDTARLLQKATQVQSIVLQEAFKQEVQQAMDRKAKAEPTWKDGDFLTEKELATIHKKLEHLAPLVETGTQTFYIAGSQTSDLGVSEFGRGLDDSFKTPAFVHGPQDAGVSGIPFLTIGAGDGQMMQNNSTDPERATGTLPIFDGLHLPLNQLENGSRVVNKAVFDSWMGNPLKAVFDSYSKFLLDADLSSFSPLANELLTKALFPPEMWEAKLSNDTIEQAIRSLETPLRQAQQSIEARHRVLAKTPMSVDQMAAAASPYANTGSLQLQGTDPQALAEQLNVEYLLELAKIQQEEVVSEDIGAEIKALATQFDSGVYVLGSADLKHLAQASKLPKDQAQVLSSVTETLATEGYQVVFGTPEQIAEYVKRNGKKGLTANTTPEGVIQGYTAIGDKSIYLINPSSETLVHELIHAATYSRILAHYEGKSTSDTAKAVKRMEVLMQQYMDMGIETFSQASPELVEAYENARAAIEGYQNQRTPANQAAALNEFMAWSLSNQYLTRLLKRNKASKLARLAQDVVAAIKALFGFTQEVGTDMFSNLLFNTRIVMRAEVSLSSRLRNSMLFQNSQYGNNARLSEVNTAFVQSVGQYALSAPQLGVALPSAVVSEAIMTSYRIGESFMAHGFPMNMQEASTFSNIVAALATEATLDANAMQAAQQLYAHVTKQLTVEHFMADPESLNPADRYYAQQKFDVVMGKYLVEIDVRGRSTLMPAFLALATVSEEFRKVLASLDLPKTEKKAGNTLDGILENLGNQAMDSLGNRMSGLGQKASNVQQAIDALNAHLVDSMEQRETFIEEMAATTGGVVDRINDKMVEGMASLSNTLMGAATRAQTNGAGRLTRLVTGMGVGLAALINEENGQKVSAGVMTAMNRMDLWKPFHTLINDLVGRTTSNANVYDMIKAVRSAVQQLRQQYRDHLPSMIAKQFSRDLSRAEWNTLYKGLGKTDLAALRTSFSNKQILEMLTDPQVLAKNVSTLETFLQKEDPTHFKVLQQKMNQLAHFMNSGVPGTNLLRNAHAVSNLFGESKQPSWQPKSKTFVVGVDHLVSMYALQDLSQEDQTSLASLAQGEAKGMDFTLSYLIGQRAEEQRKLVGAVAINNGYKGYIPTEPQLGVSMLVAPDTDYAKLLAKSYIQVGNYSGSGLDTKKGSMSYYYAPVAARAGFEQGIMQNVRQTASGIDASTGFTMAMTAGRITAPGEVKSIAKHLKSEFGAEPLLPVYGALGQVVAFERSLDPVVMERLGTEHHLAKVIGQWRGRQAEEASAQVFNEALIDNLKAMYDKDLSESLGNKAQYVNLNDSNKLDPVLKDALALINHETQTYIEQTFGSEFMVRKDMLEDALGYRAASMGDAWTGTTRWSPKTQQTVRQLAMSVFGNDAYKNLLIAEKTVQNLVSDARVVIVVKSVVVPLTNLIGNVYQLVSRGVPLASIVRGMPKKTAEVDAYAKSRIRQIEAEAELRAANGNLLATRKLTAEIQSITDSHKRLSIWPLIQAGEFSSISDVGLTRAEVMLTEGRLQGYIEQLVDKLPKPLATVGRYALVTKDTALFQGLQKAVEYGDFLAKAVLFDDLVSRKKLSQADALGRITEEFVNYDRLPGRFRGSLENLGLLWFYNFKIRIAKIAVSTIRNNPVHTLLAGLAPRPELFGSVGTPLTDNIFAKLADGTIDYSVGPGQGLHSFMLNPWMNLTQ